MLPHGRGSPRPLIRPFRFENGYRQSNGRAAGPKECGPPGSFRSQWKLPLHGGSTDDQDGPCEFAPDSAGASSFADGGSGSA